MKTKKTKWGRILLIAIFFVIAIRGFTKPISLQQDVLIQKGGTFQNFLENLSWSEKMRLKRYARSHQEIVASIGVGNYSFSGDYSPKAFFAVIEKGPSVAYLRFTGLEGRSTYDIDYDLAKKGYIQTGEYLAFVEDEKIIAKYKKRYEFLEKAGGITTLEGFLYPDTYMVDKTKDIVDQLVYLQLETFKKKIRTPLQDKIASNKREWYDTMIMASIVEKEERKKENKSIVAGILRERINRKMRVDADITLCYGYQQPYEVCTPAFIVKNLYDDKNVYNTRQQYGLPPTPIASISLVTMEATLSPTNNGELYYLHDMQGQIHTAKTIDQHNVNKNTYLK